MFFNFRLNSSSNEASTSEQSFKKASIMMSSENQREDKIASGLDVESRQAKVVRSVFERLQAYLSLTNAHEQHVTTTADVFVKGSEGSFTIKVKCFVCKKEVQLATDASSNASLSNFKRHFGTHLNKDKTCVKEKQTSVAAFFQPSPSVAGDKSGSEN